MSSNELLFLVLFALVFYTYVGYGILMAILVALKRLIFGRAGSKVVVNRKMDSGAESQSGAGAEWPEVTLLIAAYNEEAVIANKAENTKALRAPAGKLKVVWVTDGSTDSTNDLLAKYPEFKVLYQPARQGKTAAINRAMTLIDTPLVIFTDANTMLNEEAVEKIVACFSDQKVGCVAGEKRVHAAGSTSTSGEGEGLYWRYESMLKELDSKLWSAMGAAGELYAIRSNLFEPIKNDTLLDDFVLSMEIVAKGYRIEYCKNAYAIESGSQNMKEERKRKVRIAAGGLQSIWRLRKLMNPFRFPFTSLMFVSHRALRWSITPVSLFALLPLNVLLVIDEGGPLYSVLLFLQILFYIAAVIGRVLDNRGRSAGLFNIPYYFLFMNINVIAGFFYLYKKRGDGTWERAKRR